MSTRDVLHTPFDLYVLGHELTVRARHFTGEDRSSSPTCPAAARAGVGARWNERNGDQQGKSWNLPSDEVAEDGSPLPMRSGSRSVPVDDRARMTEDDTSTAAPMIDTTVGEVPMTTVAGARVSLYDGVALPFRSVDHSWALNASAVCWIGNSADGGGHL
jgi:hypothetical protein